MKRTLLICFCAVLFQVSVHTGAQAAQAAGIENNQYFCVGMMIGMVNGFVPGFRPVMDKFTFASTFFSYGAMSIDGLNDASGIYFIEDDDFGLERIEASCSASDQEKDLYLSYEIKAVNVVDLGIVGSIELSGQKDFEDAGSAVGFFFGMRNLLD